MTLAELLTEYEWAQKVIEKAKEKYRELKSLYNHEVIAHEECKSNLAAAQDEIAKLKEEVKNLQKENEQLQKPSVDELLLQEVLMLLKEKQRPLQEAREKLRELKNINSRELLDELEKPFIDQLV